MKQIFKPQNLYATIALASVMGFIASFWQMLEKIELIKNPEVVLSCNLNSVFSCTNILNAWQSSVFGFPNSLMCIIFFVMTLMVGLVGWTGGSMTKNLRLFMNGFTLFFIGFGFWYFWQSIFVVSGICIFCIFCYAAVLIISGAMFRLNYQDWPVNKNIQKTFDKLIASKNDVFIWLSIAIIIAAEMIIKFA